MIPVQGDRRYFDSYLSAIDEFGVTSHEANVAITAAVANGWSWSGITLALIEGDQPVVGTWPTEGDRRSGERRGEDRRCGERRRQDRRESDVSDHPRPGDMAEPIFGDLDPRRVTKVVHATSDGDFNFSEDLIWLDMAGVEVGPFLAEKYTYRRGDK